MVGVDVLLRVVVEMTLASVRGLSEALRSVGQSELFLRVSTTASLLGETSRARSKQRVAQERSEVRWETRGEHVGLAALHARAHV